MKRLILLSFVLFAFWTPGNAMSQEDCPACKSAVSTRKAVTVAANCDPTSSCQACSQTKRSDASKPECCQGATACSETKCGSDSARTNGGAIVDTDRKPRPWTAIFSEWIGSAPKFQVQLSMHLEADDNAHSKLGATVPVIKASVISEHGEQAGEDVLQAPRISRPMKFVTDLPGGLGKLVDEVISCGHRICTGTKCVDVKDEPVRGEDCAKPIDEDSEEEIIVVPAAPPAPPPVYVAQNPMHAEPPQGDELDRLIRESSLHQVDLPLPVPVVVKLMVERAQLATRLEMTEQLMVERSAAMEQIHALAERNARLATQAAVAEVRQQMADTLASNMIERAEQAVALATKDGAEEPKSHSATRTIQSIQEDLSNIRRQMALLRRAQPVPFAPSQVGQPARPYVPTALQVVPPVTIQQSESTTESATTR